MQSVLPNAHTGFPTNSVEAIGHSLPPSCFVALRRMPPRVFGVLMSIEAAIAALVGLLFLRETLEMRSLVAIALVIMAAIGSTLLGRQDAGH